MQPGSGSPLDYTYDASGNLTTLPTGASGTYDKAGELTSSSQSGATTSFTYNADGERLTAVQGSATTAAGTWNGAGQLTSYTNSAGEMSAAAYDGNGLRASSTVTPAGGSAVNQQYVWNTVTQIPQMIMDSSNAYIYGAGQTPAEQVNLSTGTITYLIADMLGSVRGIVSSSGSLTGTTTYDAWGNPETAGGLTATTPFGFAGGYTDPTGLIYLISRYYDPSTGQFTSVDPDLSQTQAPYSYADGNPAGATDPTGQSVNNRTSFGGEVISGGGGAGGVTVNWDVPRGWFYSEINGRGGWVHAVTAYYQMWNPLAYIYYPSFAWVFETPKGRFYRKDSREWRGQQWAEGNYNLYIWWPIAVSINTSSGPWWWVNKTFPVTSHAATNCHSELVVEDPKNPTRRGIAAQIYKLLTN